MKGAKERERTILLVESDTSVSMRLSDSVGRSGYDMITADSGQTALDILKAGGEVDFVMVDLDLEGPMSGPETARRILALRNLPLVFLTDYNGDNITEAVMEIPHYGFIIKNSGDFLLRSAIGMAIGLFETHLKEVGSEKNYQAIFDSSADALILHRGSDGAVVNVNQTMLDLFGYRDKKEAVKLVIEKLSATEEGYTEERAMLHIKDAYAGKGNLFEWRCRRKSGEFFWAEIHLNVVEIDGEEMVMASVRDITARREAEELLRKSEQSLLEQKKFIQLLFDTSPAFIVALDTDGRILTMNRALLQILEYDMPEILGKKYTDMIVPGDEREEVERHFADMLENRDLHVNQNRIVSRNGRQLLVEWYGNTVKSYDGNIEFIVGIGVDITERKNTEMELFRKNEELTAMYEEMEAANEELTVANMELQSAEERYRGVVDTQSEMIIRMKSDGTITFVNRSWRKHFSDYLGISGNVAGRNIREVFPPQMAGEMSATLKDLVLRKEPMIVEKSFKDISGELRWQIWQVQIIDSMEGRDPEYQMVGNDITDRKKAELALRESETRFKMLIELAPDAILVGNTSGVITMANRRASELTGYGLDSIIGKNIDFLFAPEELKNTPLRYDLLMEGKVVRNERMLKRADGVQVSIEMNTRMMPDGTPLAFIRDMTDWKAAEEQLSAEKEQLSVTLRSIGDGVITTDMSGNVIIMNKIAEDLTGWSQEEARGRYLTGVFNTVDETTRESTENLMERILSFGANVELVNHTLLISRDGSERYIADSGAPIRDGNNSIIGVVIVFRDMTEKRRLMEAVQKADKINFLEILSGGIAHDFNNLLSGIFGYIEMARMNASKEDSVLKYLEKAQTVFERARDLTKQLLMFSRGGPPERRTGDITEVIRKSASFALSGSRILCEYDMDEDLGLCDFDENQMGQVFDNLIINAKQAMPSGGSILITARNHDLAEKENPILRAGRYIRISVSDTGAGIPPDQLKKIFDPFFTTKSEGSGLGLATCFSIVQKHEGYIEAESFPGMGSTFHILLPVSAKITEQSPESPVVEHRGSGTVLVMDDEEFITEIAGGMLSGMGYSVLIAGDGAAALRLCDEVLARGEEIDAAILDLTVPGGLGAREIVDDMKLKFPRMPVFASSGFSQDDIILKPSEYGFTGSIRKPYRRNELALLLMKHLKGASGQ